VVRFNATTLWHIDAVEWAPSTASFALVLPCLGYVRLAGGLQFAVAGVDMGVILASKPELCFMRYELTDYEWAAVRFGVPLPK
jgi:hypothetical protein